jgi:hypothetical protein
MKPSDFSCEDLNLYTEQPRKSFHRKMQSAGKKAWETKKAKANQLMMDIAKKVQAVSEEDAERTARELTDAFYPPMAKPVEEAALWYTYYYLAEIVDDLPTTDKARFKHQFTELSKKLQDAFMDYGIYSTLRELRHADTQTRIRVSSDRKAELENWCKQRNLNPRQLEVLGYGESLGPIAKTIKTKENFLAFAQQFTALKSDEAALLWVFCNPDANWGPGKSENNAREYLAALRKEGINYTDKHYLDMAEDIFKDVSWGSGYGGNAWAGICKALKRRDIDSPTLWIDTMWAIQHNSGIWINKVNIEYGGMQSFGKYKYDVYGSLKALLDANFSGNLKAVGEVACKYEPSLSVYTSKLDGKGIEVYN